MTGCHQLVAVSTRTVPSILCKRCGGRWEATPAGIDAASNAICEAEARHYYAYAGSGTRSAQLQTQYTHNAA